MRGRKKKKKSLFITLTIGYALLAVSGSLLAADVPFSKGIYALILFGFVPVVLFAWIADVLRSGEVWRQGSRSVTASQTMNEQRVTRKQNPARFWFVIILTAVFAFAICLFVIAGISSLLILQP